MLEKLGHHPNIVGVKLTCGGIAKVACVRSRFAPETFCALAGQSDWLLPAISVGGTGTITGLANIYPRVGPPEHFPFHRAPKFLTIYFSRHALNCTIFPLAARPKKQKLHKSSSRLLSGGLPRAVSMARNGWLLNAWDIPRLAAIPDGRILGSRTRRSRLGLWILCGL